ncbi:MAG: pseudouridine synthase, partial [Firmicutes bacterium]|nr:pseudouridine synthase [Bacillota bacterium]
KDVATQAKLTSMLQRREIKREYIGIVEGNLTGSGVINKNIVRHPNKRTLFTTCPVGKGRTAITHYAVEKNFGRYSLVRFKLETGRTHQIRVHIKSLGHPLVGDPEYNPKGGDGQLLEAVRVAFVHPKTGKQIDIQIKPTEKLTMFIKKIVFSTNNHCNKRSR